MKIGIVAIVFGLLIFSYFAWISRYEYLVSMGQKIRVDRWTNEICVAGQSPFIWVCGKPEFKMTRGQ
ncbi:MAG: hypothetical protein CMC15_15860 [Flavobacteriaceae bacterium]|jgi:hypothetical protein|nr:hypothetical protein [Flavobacteriaceae bacterium]|tara:strand:- start:781 stop:981 length:201 start_codon:yes stop_codon:yes gene_type:complete